MENLQKISDYRKKYFFGITQISSYQRKRCNFPSLSPLPAIVSLMLQFQSGDLHALPFVHSSLFSFHHGFFLFHQELQNFAD